MQKCFHLVLSLIALALVDFTKTHRCIHDEIQPKIVDQHSESLLQYKMDRKRRTSEASIVHRNIRITEDFRNLENNLDVEEQGRLQKVTEKALILVEHLLSVIPVEGPLILPRSVRDACWRLVPFNSPLNAGKCAGLNVAYVGEVCLNLFQIPENHLEGLWIWDSESSDPIKEIYPTGPGIEDSDFILYVMAEYTTQCTSDDVVAYAGYCKVDHDGRPVAGLVNFCPTQLSTENFDEDRYVLIALHELFHTLGFSSSLFTSFQDCLVQDSQLVCQPYTDVTHTVLDGVQRLVTPQVVNQTQRHFNCSARYFGGPLENQDSGSHWESTMMQGSIMTPTLGLAHLTLLDPITLAVFEDSGWYLVDYSYAQQFWWGRDQGCGFGLPTDCPLNTSNAYFCQTSGHSGCHYIHQDKGTCGTNNFLDDCMVYKAETKDMCGILDNSLLSEVDFEVYGGNSSCLLASVTKENEQSDKIGYCFKTECNEDSLSVKLGNSSWAVCPYNSFITDFHYNLTIYCPVEDYLCQTDNDNSLKFPLDTEPIKFQTTTTLATNEDVSTPLLDPSTPTQPDPLAGGLDKGYVATIAVAACLCVLATLMLGVGICFYLKKKRESVSPGRTMELNIISNKRK